MEDGIFFPPGALTAPLIPLRSPRANALRPTALALGSLMSAPGAPPRDCAIAADPAPGLVPTVVSFWPTPASCSTGEPRLRLDLPPRAGAAGALVASSNWLLVPHPRAGCTDARAFVEQVLVGAVLEPAMWPSAENFRFGLGAQRRLRRSAGIGHPPWAAGARLPIALDGEGAESAAAASARPGAGPNQRSHPLAGAPLRFRRPGGARGRGLGRGLGLAHRQPPGGRSQIPACEGVYAAWAPTAWLAAGRLVGRGCSG